MLQLTIYETNIFMISCLKREYRWQLSSNKILREVMLENGYNYIDKHAIDIHIQFRNVVYGCVPLPLENYDVGRRTEILSLY